MGHKRLSVCICLRNVNTDDMRAENGPSSWTQPLKFLQVESSGPVLLTTHQAETQGQKKKGNSGGSQSRQKEGALLVGDRNVSADGLEVVSVAAASR